MLKSYFKIALRNLLRHKEFSFINIAGLAIGMACCILVALFIIDELSYDRHNQHSERIYRVVKDFVNDDGSRLPDATTPPAIGATIQKDIPEIEHVARMMPGWATNFMYAMERNGLLKRTCTEPTAVFLMYSLSIRKRRPKNRLTATKCNCPY